MAIQLTIALVPLVLLFTSIHIVQSGDFDVVADYGAKADGKTDMNKALLDAWKEACASKDPSSVVIPEGEYFLSPILLEGPCEAPISIKVQGTIMAPPDSGAFEEPKWITFNHVDGFTMSGTGVFDGQGAACWAKQMQKKDKYPINLRFDFVDNAMIQDITTKDSKQFHINVIGCNNITFQSLTIIAPDESPNTDGIHIGRSDGVYVLDCKIQTGDDCVSMGDGSKNVHVEGVTCGPGHGISVGSLGKYENEEPVNGIFVKKCSLSNTLTGVRIKTWPASYPGTATDMNFEDITMDNVECPIIVDQEYCPHSSCDLKVPSRVQLNKISFKNIQGTSSEPEAVKLICSSGSPCEDVELDNIDITYSGSEGKAVSKCLNVNPVLSGTQNPPICSEKANDATEKDAADKDATKKDETEKDATKTDETEKDAAETNAAEKDPAETNAAEKDATEQDAPEQAA